MPTSRLDASVADGVAIGCLPPGKSLAIPQRPQLLISLWLILFEGSLRHRLAFHPPPQGWAVFPTNLINFNKNKKSRLLEREKSGAINSSSLRLS
jgi:hypothetical protein